MKKVITLLCFVLALVMVVSCAACRSSKDNSSSIPSDLDNTVGAGDTDNTDSGNDGSDSQGEKVSASGSWQNVLKSMPSDLRGTCDQLHHYIRPRGR